MMDVSLHILHFLKRIEWTIAILLTIAGTGNLYGQCTWTWYRDADNDGFGAAGISTTTPCGDQAPLGYVANKLDCNDNNQNGPAWLEADRQIADVTGFLPEVRISSDSIPFVMYVNTDNRLTVSRYNSVDEDWHALGTAGFSPTLQAGLSASMALDANMPYVSYASQSGPGQLTVMKYAGATWQTVNPPAAFYVTHTDIAVHNGEPYVVYNTNVSGSDDLYVLRYTAGGWQVLGGGSLGVGLTPKIAVDKNTGAVYVAYSDYRTGSGKITVRKFQGAWTTVGSPEFSVDLIEYLQIATDQSGMPYVTYFDYGTFKIVVQRYNAGWEVTGIDDVYNDYPSDVSLAISPQGIPYVAYSYFNLLDNTYSYAVKRLWADSWEKVVDDPVRRGEGSNVVTGDQLSIAIAPNGIPYIAFRDVSNSDYVSVLQWGAMSCPLPLSLLYFKATVDEPAAVGLSWATTREINLSRFSIERSADGKEFSTLDYVTAAGNSELIRRYLYTDQNPFQGKNYYRLRSIDFDGSYSYSDLVVADCKYTMIPYLKIYPNPAEGYRISYSIGFDPLSDDEIHIFNGLGQLVFKNVVAPLNNQIEFEKQLEPGCYVLKYLSGRTEFFARFIVL